jgi:hypothetical protein
MLGMKFKKGDLIKTTNAREHIEVVGCLKNLGMKIDRATWKDRHVDFGNRYNKIFYNGKKWETYDPMDMVVFDIKRKTRRKLTAKETLSLRTTYVGSKLKHRFF